MSNVAVFEAEIDTSKLIAGSERAKRAFDEIAGSGTRAFDSLQGQVEVLQAKIDSLEQRISQSNQKNKASFTQLSGVVTGLTSNLALQYFTWDNLDKVKLRVTSTTRRYEEQLAKVKKMQQEGKVGTQEYAFELRQLEEMQQRARQAQSDLTQANVMFGLSMATLATTTIPNAIKAIQSTDLSLKALRTTLWTIATHPAFLAVTGFFLAWEFGISKVIEKTQGLKDGEASIVQGLQRLWESQTQVTSDGITGFSQYSSTVGETSSAIQGLVPALGSVTEQTGRLTKTITSYSQALDVIKGKTNEISMNDFIGNVNESLRKLAISELPSKDFENFDRFVDIRGFDILSSYDEKWNAITQAIRNANISTVEHQRNVHQAIKLTLLPDMKEYAEVIKDANDPRRIQAFRQEIQLLAKDFRISKEQAKELLDVFDKKKAESFDLRKYELVNGKLVEIKVNAHDAQVQFEELIDSLNNAQFNLGRLFGSESYLPFSGILLNGAIEASNTILYSFGLLSMASEALRDGDIDAYRTLTAQAKSGINAVGSFRPALVGNNRQKSFGHSDFAAGKFPQDMGRIVSGIGVRGSGQAGRGVSGSAKARRRGGKGGKKSITEQELLLQAFGARGSANAGTQAFFTQQAIQRYNQTLDLLTEAGLSMPSVFRYGVMRGRYGQIGINENFSAELSALVARAQEIVAENRFRNVTGFSRETGRQYASQLGISLDDITRTMSNELTYNDVLAQINFQRRLASISA
ncbi:MAG TPA: hypothetical protein VNK25_00515 [Candidatus Nitrosotenuis sp.]|nr:hypothetical protein [Candidatus Nitrosotenuis sp.]